MTPNKPIDTVDEPLGVDLIVEDFCAVEMLRKHLAKLGWAVDYLQLDAGNLQARLAFRAAGGITLVRTAISRRVIGSSRSPDDLFTIAMSASKSALL